MIGRERYVTGITKDIAKERLEKALYDGEGARANEVQVGGNHYKKAGVFQHWDFVHDNAIPYLIGNCTKYLSRWRDKNGLQDLAKALHYAVKFREKMAERWEPCPRVSTDALLRFAEAYDLDPQAETATILLCRYRSMEDLDGAVAAIQRLILRNTK